MRMLLNCVVVIFLLGVTCVAEAKDAVIVDHKVSFSRSANDLRSDLDVRGYIVAGLERYKNVLSYSVEHEKLGEMIVKFNRLEKHYLTLRFTYGSSGLTASYVDSKNLNFKEVAGERRIHGNYAIWLDALLNEIDAAYRLYLDERGVTTRTDKVAKITFKQEGGSGVVLFGVAKNDDTCPVYKKLPKISSRTDSEIAEREIEIKEWHEKNGKFSMFGVRVGPARFFDNKVTELFPAGQPVQVSSNWSMGELNGVQDAYGRQGTNLYSCSPAVVRFVPEGGKSYVVTHMNVENGRRYWNCGLLVTDVAAEPSAKVRLEKPVECNN